ncbi:MAG: hypothetical protein AVDCRST_MAG35-1080, partial [uncultured Quadrisphaera sp.]
GTGHRSLRRPPLHHRQHDAEPRRDRGPPRGPPGTGDRV